jgi:ABC-type antimicrobial peptide transport system permease subunit
VLNAGDLATVPAVMLVVCVLAGFGPAVMASRMRPADSLRYV